MSSEEKSSDISEFIASFPDVQSAITFHGSGGMRIQLDIPENQIGEAAKLLMWREQLLRVTIVPMEKEGGSDILAGIVLSEIIA